MGLFEQTGQASRFDTLGATVIWCQSEKNLTTVSFRHVDCPDTQNSPNFTVVVDAQHGQTRQLATWIEDIRTLVASEGDLFKVDGEIRDLSILRDLGRIGRVTANNLRVTNRNLSGLVLKSIDFRRCRFEGVTLHATNFAGSSFDAKTQFLDCPGFSAHCFDTYMALDGISTAPIAVVAKPAGVLGRVCKVIKKVPANQRQLSAEGGLREICASEYLHANYPITDSSGVELSPGSRTPDRITIHFEGGCVVLEKLVKDSAKLRAEVFQLAEDRYQVIAPRSGRLNDSPILVGSTDDVLRWAAVLCHRYPLSSSNLSARAGQYRGFVRTATAKAA